MSEHAMRSDQETRSEHVGRPGERSDQETRSEHVGRFWPAIPLRGPLGPGERSDQETRSEHVGRFWPGERSDQETQ
jgi:hypothetical protein